MVAGWLLSASVLLLLLQLLQIVDLPWYVLCGPAMMVPAMYLAFFVIGAAIALCLGAKGR